jgi:hypothetical protein
VNQRVTSDVPQSLHSGCNADGKAARRATIDSENTPMTTTEYPTQTMASQSTLFLLIHEGEFTELLTKEKTV